MERTNLAEEIQSYFAKLDDLDSKKMMELVDKYLDAEAIEVFVDHIQDFYGVEDEEELGLLAQMMIAGYICALETNPRTLS